VTAAHFIFIPAVFSFGLLCGFLAGGRVMQDRLALERKRDAEREAARKARAERKAAGGDAPPADA
jgi:hypothetical protein